MAKTSQELKLEGNNYFSSKNQQLAILLQSYAIGEEPNDHILYSNRSACQANRKDYIKAYSDACKCIELKPDWAKGYSRKGVAEFHLNKLAECIKTFELGLQYEPNNQTMIDGLIQAKCKLNPNESKTNFINNNKTSDRTIATKTMSSKLKINNLEKELKFSECLEIQTTLLIEYKQLNKIKDYNIMIKNRALTQYKKYQHSSEIIDLKNSINDYKLCLEYFINTKDIFKSKSLCVLLINILYTDMNDFEEGQKYQNVLKSIAKDISDNDLCEICSEEFNEEKLIIQDKCYHTFHFKCNYDLNKKMKEHDNNYKEVCTICNID